MRATAIKTLKQTKTPATQALKRRFRARITIRIIRVVIIRRDRAVLVIAPAHTFMQTRRRGAFRAARDTRLLSVAALQQVKLVQTLGRVLFSQLDKTQPKRG